MEKNLETEGFCQSTLDAFSQPFRGVEFDLFLDAEFLERERLVGESVVEYLFRYLDILEAVFAQLLYISFFPPYLGLQTVGYLFCAERAFRYRIELHASAQDSRDFLEKIKRADFREVARIVFIEDGDVEVVRIVADEEVGRLEQFPEAGEVFLEE